MARIISSLTLQLCCHQVGDQVMCEVNLMVPHFHGQRELRDVFCPYSNTQRVVAEVVTCAGCAVLPADAVVGVVFLHTNSLAARDPRLEYSTCMRLGILPVFPDQQDYLLKDSQNMHLSQVFLGCGAPRCFILRFYIVPDPSLPHPYAVQVALYTHTSEAFKLRQYAGGREVDVQLLTMWTDDIDVNRTTKTRCGHVSTVRLGWLDEHVRRKPELRFVVSHMVHIGHASLMHLYDRFTHLHTLMGRHLPLNDVLQAIYDDIAPFEKDDGGFVVLDASTGREVC
jgi:hypothetical protein